MLEEPCNERLITGVQRVSDKYLKGRCVNIMIGWDYSNPQDIGRPFESLFSSHLGIHRSDLSNDKRTIKVR